MMTSQAAQTIELSVQIAASRETVFRFFSDPQRYKLLMGENSTITPGASGKLTVSYGPGPTAVGKITDWREPERIAFEWSHEGDAKSAPSRVTITLREIPEGTLVILVHEGIVETVQREGTKAGWTYYLSTLNNVVLAEQLSELAPRRIGGYLSAWAEPDAARRGAILAQSVANDLRFRDRYGAIDGLENLSDYIGGVQRMMGAATIQPEGSLDRVHSFFLQNWKVSGPDGQVAFRGQNVYEFDGEARLKLIVGFWS